MNGPLPAELKFRENPAVGGTQIPRYMCFLGGEQITLGIYFSRVGEHVSVRICFSQVREHILLGIGVLGREIEITRNMFFPGWGTQNTRDIIILCARPKYSIPGKSMY